MRRALLALACLTAFAAAASAAPAVALPAVASPAVAASAVTAPAYHGEAQLLVDEPDLLGAMRTMIRGAKTSLLVDYYIFGGPQGAEIARLLAERQAAGVRVAVLLDAGLGTMPAVRAQTEPVLRTLLTAGIPVRLWASATSRPGARSCDHNKVLVADEGEAIVSSMNLGGPLIASHDAGVWLTGGAARAIAQQVRAAFDAAPQLAFEEPAPWPTHDLPAPRGEARVRLWPTEPAHPAWDGARATVVSALEGARASVEVELLKLTDPAAIAALIAATQRGVQVRVLLDPGRHGRVIPGGLAPAGLYNLAAAKQLAAGGADVRWYVPRAHELALHIKAARIDGRRLLIGSTNWTTDGFTRNRELLLDINGGAAPGQFGPVFEAAWTERSEPVAFAWGPLAELQLALYRGMTALAD